MNSIVLKLGSAIIFLLLVVLFPLGYVVDKVFSTFYYQKAVQNLDVQSDKIVELITSNKNPEVVSSIIVTMEMTNNRVALLNSSKQVVTKANTTLNIEDMLSEDDWDKLMRGSSIVNHWISPDFILVGKPVIYDGHFNGAVLMVTSTEDIQSSVSQIRNVLILTGIGAILLALGFTVILVRRLSIPLLTMERAARTMAKGDLSVRVKMDSNDELGSLAKAINDLASSLKRYEDTRKEFFVNISHELRTPLTYIEGYIRLLSDEIPESPEERSQIIQIITNETNRLKGLVDDLFDLSKLEEGKIALTLEWIDLSEVIENALEKVRLRAEQKEIKIELNEDDTPIMYLDGYRMQQILINLLDNAIRYTENGMIIVNLNSETHEVIIQVSDSGIGIPEEELPFIFERFHRVEKSRSREYGGTGLGLAIVKRLVEIQGGTITVDSAIGVGTTFTIRFPVPTEEKIQ
ncbi:ATP-binding protein [Ammoniphilus sp. 3BR4]|uniref:sensor histidine kinase n=1 Tax=Ammoniphilus sp. 3BR4 TaxID=3158265 RepID=UPI0034668DAA